jgi:Competence protein
MEVSQSQSTTMRGQIAKGFLSSCIIYSLLIILLNDLPRILQENGLLKNTVDISSWAEQKAVTTSEQMKEANLAMNFLGNLRKLNFEEAKAFQSSGLLHLLAISGGQVVPLANGFSNILGYILYYFLYKKLKPHHLMQFIFNVKTNFSLIISLFICSLFGCTGALIRVSALSYMLKLRILQSQYSFFFKFIPYVMPTTFNRVMVIIFISFSFGNVFISYSFLLSAIGATTAEISSYITNFFFKKPIILQVTCSTVLTSIFTGIILSPFSSIDILNSCFANILALPVVCFFITPFSLLALFLPTQFFLYPYVLLFLDYSLIFFKKIAFTFYNPYSKTNPFDKNNPLFSLEGLVYLNAILIILWILLDVHRERKIFLARKKFLSLKP